MKNNISTLFYLKKPENYSIGSVPIYMRITVDGMRKDFSTGMNCDPVYWDAKSNRIIGSRQEVRSFNNYLLRLRSKLT